MPSRKPKKLQLGPYHAEPHRPPSASSPFWSWRLSYFHQGKRVSLVMPDGSKASGRFDAKEAHRRLTVLFLRNPAPGAIAPEDPAASVGRVVERYLDARDREAGLSDASKAHYRAKARLLEERGVYAWPLDRLERFDDLLDLRDRLVRQGHSASTIHQAFKLLRMVVRRATRSSWVRPLSMPALKDLNLPDPKKGRRRSKVTPSRETTAKVLQAVGSESEVGMIIHLLANLGARIGEVVDLQRDQIDLEVGRITLDGKTGPRTVPFPGACRPTLVALAAREPGRSGRVFRGDPTSLRTQTNRALRRACEDLGVRPFSSHGFRRRKATDLMARGMPPKDYKEFMGHSYAVGLEIYAEVDPKETLEAVRATAFGVPPDDPEPAVPNPRTTGARYFGRGAVKLRDRLNRPPQRGRTRSPEVLHVALPVGVLPALRAVVPLRTGSR